MLPVPTRDEPDGMDANSLEFLEKLPPFNILWMLGRTGWLSEISALLSEMFDDAQFPAVDREVMVLRIAALCDIDYVLSQHKEFAKSAGLTQQNIDAIISNDLNSLDQWTAALCEICDEITRSVVISEVSLQKLIDQYGPNGATKAIWLLGWFNMLVRFAGSARIPLEHENLAAELSTPVEG